MGNNQSAEKLIWWQLSILGIGFVIGTGYFLGSTIAIQAAGPAVTLTFLLAAIGTFIVYDALSRMTANDPQQGSFSYYSYKAYGRWAGFSSGWVYWASEMLIMGSQMTGISIFSRFWFENVPIWLFATIYTVLGIIVMLVGIKWFERLGNVFAIAKLSAIIMFIIIAALAILGVIDGDRGDIQYNAFTTDFFSTGLTGAWAGLLFSFYAFGGIEVLSIYATRLKDPKDAPKAGKLSLIMLSSIYIFSVGLAIFLVPINRFNMDESPFVVALGNFQLNFVPHVFNAILIIAGFSTMVASLFAVTTMLKNLAQHGNAPSRLGKDGKLAVPLPALIVTVSGLVLSIIIGLFLPDSVYEYITTAASLMLLYNWLFILYSAKKLLKTTAKDHIKRYIGSILILFAISGSLFVPSSRPGFFVSLGFVGLIGIVTLIMQRKWKRGTNETKIEEKGIYQVIKNSK